MEVAQAHESDINLLALLLRAEAEGEGLLGMLLVRNVGINRICANFPDLIEICTLQQMIYEHNVLRQQRVDIFFKHH